MIKVLLFVIKIIDTGPDGFGPPTHFGHIFSPDLDLGLFENVTVTVVWFFKTQCKLCQRHIAALHDVLSVIANSLLTRGKIVRKRNRRPEKLVILLRLIGRWTYLCRMGWRSWRSEFAVNASSQSAERSLICSRKPPSSSRAWSRLPQLHMSVVVLQLVVVVITMCPMIGVSNFQTEVIKLSCLVCIIIGLLYYRRNP